MLYINKITSNSDKHQTQVDFSRVKRNLQSLILISEPRELHIKAQNAFQDGSQSSEQPQRSKRKRIESSESALVETRARSKKLILFKVADVEIRSYKYMRIKNESSWQSLRKVYELKLDDFIIVTIRKSSSCEIVIVKNFVDFDRK